MKKFVLLVMIALLLSGCSGKQTFETVDDELVQPAVAQQRQILLQLPEETLLPAMECDGRTLYLCSGYDVAVQTLSAGNLDATVRQICGFGSEDVTIMETAAGESKCYEFAWTMATDLGEQVGRAMILDDGNYHYTLTATTPADKAQEYQQIWNGMFDTFGLE